MVILCSRARRRDKKKQLAEEVGGSSNGKGRRMRGVEKDLRGLDLEFTADRGTTDAWADNIDK